MQFRTTPASQDRVGNIVVSIKTKEALVRRSAFPKSPTNISESPAILFGSAHTKIHETLVGEALMTQAATKAPGPAKINLPILQLIWGWDKVRITSIVYHPIQLGYHPTQ